MKTQNPDLERFECIRCGECCQSYTQTLLAHHEDIMRWRKQGRMDILRHVKIHRKGNVLFGEIWMDPKTGKELEICPFLKDSLCSIQRTKPHVCREYICRKHPKLRKELL